MREGGPISYEATPSVQPTRNRRLQDQEASLHLGRQACDLVWGVGVGVSSEYGTYKTVKARLWRCLLVSVATSHQPSRGFQTSR